MPSNHADPAAVFAVALSVWQECHEHAANDPSLNLSDAYSGVDGLMREAMRVAERFENWACSRVDFDNLGEPWPHYRQDHFGRECLSVLRADRLADFDGHDCQRVALRLRLPLRARSIRT